MHPIVKVGYMYILTNEANTTLYVGVTSELHTRIYKHKSNYYSNSFSARYKLKKLVYYKCFDTIQEAVWFEKKLKGGNRDNKINLICSLNPTWRDLSAEIYHFD